MTGARYVHYRNIADAGRCAPESVLCDSGGESQVKEQNPQRAEALELERELTETREENVCLAQQLSELSQRDVHSDLETNETEIGVLKKTNARLESETTDLPQQWAERSEELSESKEALERTAQRAEQAEDYRHRLEGSIDQVHQEAELEHLHAVTGETSLGRRESGRSERRGSFVGSKNSSATSR